LGDAENIERWKLLSERTGFQQRAAGMAGHWDNAKFIQCSDGKARPVGPGVFPLAHGVSARMGKLRAAGNAIVPALAAQFIQAFLECEP
jgi:DNA (cytosine-5)-methyltransferase 1